MVWDGWITLNLVALLDSVLVTIISALALMYNLVSLVLRGLFVNILTKITPGLIL